VTHAKHRAGGSRSAFTLIEVLIGVLVLGLGLLGLAAVYPAVVVQQRQASDAVQGESVAKSAEQLVLGLRDLRAPGRGLSALREDTRASSPLGQWVIPGEADTAQFAGGDGSNAFGTGPGEVAIPVQLRLLPSPRPSTGGGAGAVRFVAANDEPRFVWDMAVRRVLASNALGARARADDPLQVAVFVRRIDVGIRRGKPLHDRFADRGWVPVAVDREGRPTFDGGRGEAASNGNRQYSPIVRGQLQLVRQRAQGQPTGGTRLLDRVTISQLPGEELRPYVEQIGQLFVTPKGRVVRVTDAERVDNAVVLSLSPALSADEFAGGDTLSILLTPQTPVEVQVFTIDAEQ
jgi:type II secretory pathway pseudopilin PulG